MTPPIKAAVFGEVAVVAARSREATAIGAQAFARLLALADPCPVRRGIPEIR